jgi:hypothetical protein
MLSDRQSILYNRRRCLGFTREELESGGKGQGDCHLVLDLQVFNLSWGFIAYSLLTCRDVQLGYCMFSLKVCIPGVAVRRVPHPTDLRLNQK